MDIKLINNQLVVDLDATKTRTKAQAYALRELIKSGQLTTVISYLQSFKANKYSYDRVHVSKPKQHGIDKLEDKAAESVYRVFQRMLDLSRSHTPNSAEQTWVGVEIECMIPKDRFEESSNECGECGECGGSGEDEVYDDDGELVETRTCDCCGGSGEGDAEEYSHYHDRLRYLFEMQKVKFTNIKHDGSISEESGYFPVEITVLTRLNKPDNLRQVCKLLADLGAKVNKSCGMHVHLDARHLTSRQVSAVGLKFQNALPVLLGMVPKSRREGNTYCRAAVSELRGGRYYAVNLTSYLKYRTVEVRLHSSTTDFDKIISWTRLIQAIMAAPRLNKRCLDVNALTEFLYLDETLIEYISQRTALFSGQTCSVAARDADSTDETDLFGLTL